VELPFTAAEIAKHLTGEVVGDGSIKLTGFAPADAARAGDLTFAENDNYLAKAEQSAASAILVSGDAKSNSKVLIRVANPRAAFAKVLPLFFPEPKLKPGIHSSAIVASSAQIDPSAHIGPLCILGERVRIGPRCILHGAVSLGADCSLGEEVHVMPNVTLYANTQVGHRVRIHAGAVIGSDGFGYVFDQGRHLKVPQVGHVMIQDDVEIGANVAIDRGALGPTVIGRGTKIDNLVQIGHNVILGEHCILCGQVGVSGSTKLGNYVTVAGQVGLAGHLKLGDRVTVGAKAGVMNDIPDGEMWLGTPAMHNRQMKRIFIGWQRLPELLQRVAELERQLEALKDGSAGKS
jgi:UDP-3-O-[3-hydroxymyristoyl] glucosamine N-acyltransferase